MTTFTIDSDDHIAATPGDRGPACLTDCTGSYSVRGHIIRTHTTMFMGSSLRPTAGGVSGVVLNKS